MTNWKNVNNWHWIEKNCLNWSRDYFVKKFKEIETEEIKITSSKIEGDVDINVRKGKVLYIFDINICLDLKVDGKEGKLKLPECCYDVNASEYAYEIDFDDLEKKEKVKSEFVPKILNLFKEFPSDLLKENAPDLLVESQNTSKAEDVGVDPEILKEHGLATKLKPTFSSKVSNVVVSVESEFKCSAEDLFQSLFIQERVQIYASPCQVSPKADSSFSLFNNLITGKLKTVGKNGVNYKIEMEWKLKHWESFSLVSMQLKQESDYTKLVLKQKGVPKTEEENVKGNWEEMIFARVKGLFGYGM